MTSILKKSSLLVWFCLTISVGLHLASLFVFYHHPLILHSYVTSFFGKTTPELLQLEAEEQEEALAEQKSQLIEEVFEKILVLSPQFQRPFDLAGEKGGLTLSPGQEEGQELSSQQEGNTLFLEGDTKEASHVVTASITPSCAPSATPLLLVPESASEILPQIELDTHLFGTEIALSTHLLPFLDQESVEEVRELGSEVVLEADYETFVEGVALSKSLNAAVEVLPFQAGDLKLDARERLPLMRTEAFAPAPPKSQKLTLHVSKAPVTPPESWEKRSPEGAVQEKNIDAYALPKLASALNWNEDFDVDLRLTPKAEGEGYLFSITLRSNVDASDSALKQNIYFLIDRSSSIEKHRFSVFKRAVLKALSSMQTNDHFNIYLLDKKIVRLSEKALPFTLKTLQAAEDFLERQEHGGLFAAADVYTSLEKILSEIPANDEVHSAILLTDGNTVLSAPKQHKVLNSWLDKNKGRLDLYTAAAAQGNNLLLLDMLSTISGGKLIYSDTNTSFPRKLAKLILNLREPLAKEMMAALVPSDPKAHIELYPATSHLPSLYGQGSYTLYGSIDEPTSFELVLQGRHKDQWVAIKKSISFLDAEKGDRVMRKKCGTSQISLCYDQFLHSGKPKHLQEAKKLFQEIGGEVAFE